jgi:isocitrate dehydrogenase kinase/phosphatase
MNSSTVSPAPAPITDSRLAALCAQRVRQAFFEHQERFNDVTRRARQHFLARDFAGTYADAATRLHLYGGVLTRLVTDIENLVGPRLRERGLWMAIKAVYSALISQSSEWEIAESFFNSLTRRVFATAGVDQAIEFVDTDFDAPPTPSADEILKRYSGDSLPQLLIAALTDPEIGGFSAEHWNNLLESVLLAAERIEKALSIRNGTPPAKISLEMIGNVFYRGHGAYFVGRAIRSGDERNGLPLALCLRHPNQSGITLDAVLFGEVDLAILFSYTRAHFRVEAPCPYQLVRLLREWMPRKRLVDLYNAIGYHRHGKTEFYRDFVAHLRSSRDQFVAAEGSRGMVMLVFTLPSYDVVFKLIKDRFDFPKDSSREQVMRCYRLVFDHDRGGRLVEAHEFEHLRIPQERFDPALLEDFRRNAAQTVRFEGDDVIIMHAYVERRVRPLNLFLAEAEPEAAAAAARDYGQAIKDLAASNIFPGDIFTKNFGVTRNGRVVFYDYDELTFLVDCNFRDMPQAVTHEQEMAAEPWFSVRENDIFPEEFPNFLSLPGSARGSLMERHGDLFRADFWRGVQQKLKAGEIPEIFPYGRERRLAPSLAS